MSNLKIDKHGNKIWLKNGKTHREDGPAIEYSNGTKCWYKNGELHRDDGPAVEYSDGEKLWYNGWYKNGELHREDGPAIENLDGYKRWYYHDKEIECSSQKGFEKFLKLKIF